MVALDVAKAPTDVQLPVRIDESDGKKERLVVRLGSLEEYRCSVCHVCHVSRLALLLDLPGVGGPWADVDFPENSSSVPEPVEYLRRSFDIWKRLEAVTLMVESIAPGFVSVQACVNDGPATTARCGARESHVELGPRSRQGVEVRCLYGLAAVATRLLPTKIIGDEKQDVLWLRHG